MNDWYLEIAFLCVPAAYRDIDLAGAGELVMGRAEAEETCHLADYGCLIKQSCLGARGL